MNILGTRPEDIDRAEDRDKFSAMLDSIGVDQVTELIDSQGKYLTAVAHQSGL